MHRCSISVMLLDRNLNQSTRYFLLEGWDGLTRTFAALHDREYMHIFQNFRHVGSTIFDLLNGIVQCFSDPTSFQMLLIMAMSSERAAVNLRMTCEQG